MRIVLYLERAGVTRNVEVLGNYMHIALYNGINGTRILIGATPVYSDIMMFMKRIRTPKVVSIMFIFKQRVLLSGFH